MIPLQTFNESASHGFSEQLSCVKPITVASSQRLWMVDFEKVTVSQQINLNL